MFRHMIRDCKDLEKRLESGQEVNLPDECKHNSKVIYGLLLCVDRAVPELKLFSNQEIKTMADAMAYIIRTDIIKGGVLTIGPTPYQKGFITPLEDSLSTQKKIHLKNDPSILTPEYVFPGVGEIPEGDKELERQANRGTYLGSYVWKITEWMGITGKFKYLNDILKIGDALAYLLDPDDLTDYNYSQKELKKFHNVLEEQAREV